MIGVNLRFFVQKHNSRQQFIINAASNIGLFLINVLIGMWFVPFLILHLGVAAYGLVPLTTTLTSYLSLLTLSLNGAMGRFLTIELKNGEFSTANRIFNTALFTSFGLSGLVLFISLIIVSATPKLFNIPVGQEIEAQALLGLVALSFVVTTIESNFSVSTWALNRFDIRNGWALMNRLVQVSIVGLLFSFLDAHLWYVGFGILCAALASFAGSVLIWRYLTPQLSINLRLFDRFQLRQLTGMSGWMFINQVGSLLFLNIDLIVVNRFFGSEAGGKYGAVLQLSAYVRTFANMLAGVLTPTMVAKFGVNDVKGISEVSRQSVKLLGLVLALPVGLSCGFSKPFLSIWLGPSFEDLASLMILLSAHLCVNLAVLPLFSVQVAYNKVRWPGIVTLVGGLANLALAISLVKWGKFGMLGVAIAGAITLTIKNILFTPIYSAIIQKIHWWKYFPAIMPAALGTIMVSSLAYMTTQLFILDSWMELVLAGVVVSSLFGLAAYVFMLNLEERKLLLGLIFSK